jgi:hypothetical protein
MELKKTKIINLISSPSTGKSIMSALIFAEMKKNNLQVELVQEYIKRLIWANDTEALKDQYNIAKMQYHSILNMNGKIDYIVLDGSLINNMYYNNDVKAQYEIQNWLNEFENIYIFIERNDKFPFEKEGRIHNLIESIKIEQELKKLVLNLQLDVKYIKSNSEPEFIKNLVANLNL